MSTNQKIDRNRINPEKEPPLWFFSPLLVAFIISNVYVINTTAFGMKIKDLSPEYGGLFMLTCAIVTLCFFPALQLLRTDKKIIIYPVITIFLYILSFALAITLFHPVITP